MWATLLLRVLCPGLVRGIDRERSRGPGYHPARREVGGLLLGLIETLRAAEARGASQADILEEVLDRTGYLAELRRSEDPQDASRVENLAELYSVAGAFAADAPGGTRDSLERVVFVADSDQVPAEGSAVGRSPS